MRIAVLPFNPTEGTDPAYGRQLAAIIADLLRAISPETPVDTVTYLTQVQEQDGSMRPVLVNMTGTLVEKEQLEDLFNQSQAEIVMDGLMDLQGDAIDLKVRFHQRGGEAPVHEESLKFTREEIFLKIGYIAAVAARQAGLTPPESLGVEPIGVGTLNADAFFPYLQTHDSMYYLQQSGGLPHTTFTPDIGLDAGVQALETDSEFLRAYEVLVQLCLTCASMQVGTFEKVDAVLRRATEIVPDQWPAFYALGQVHQAIGSPNIASDMYEKAVQMNPEDPGLLTRLGIVQMQLGMPVNAERNFRKAMEHLGEEEEYTPVEYLSMVLMQTGRDHEVPKLWQDLIEKRPHSAQPRVQLATVLIQSNRAEEGERAFEEALEALEDNLPVKRWYAPYLAQKGEHDRAMDFYEDVLDTNPNDVQALIEYAQVLEAGGREFEVPRVLKDVLACNPDANTRAQVMSKLIELEQPKRVESVNAAHKKLEEGDFAGAISSLKPLRNWLADYWRMWWVLAAAYNRSDQFKEAEEASQRLLELFPGNELAFVEYSNSLVGQDRHDEAYNLLTYASQQMPQSLPVHVNLALAAKRVGQTDQARLLAKQLRESLGENSDLEPVLAEIEA
jgi:tetratricopeptide (TPR) repeat protein